MSGIPPPSASYLLVLDTSSSEGSDDDDEHQKIRAERSSPPAANYTSPQEESRENATATTKSASKIPKSNDITDKSLSGKPSVETSIIIPESDEITDVTPASPSKKKKKRKKKRKKKKKHGVTFDHVSVRQYERGLGTDVVPADGGWPLGLTDTVTSEPPAEKVDIDAFEQERHGRLQERFKTKFPSEPVPEVLETRQYDYKRRIEGQTSHKNPLFGIMEEKARMELLLEASKSTDDADTDASEKLKSKKKSQPDSPKKTQWHGRTRSSSNAGRPRSGSNADSYEYNDVYTSTDVLHVRNELEQIRNARGSEQQGCSCHHAKKKKKKKNNMTERKVKDELRKRHKLPEAQLSKQELIALLDQVTQDEPCCWGDDCPCVRSGIECHADVCSCWQTSNKASYSAIEDIQTVCGNRYGIEVVDTNAIKSVRELYCQPVAVVDGEE